MTDLITVKFDDRFKPWLAAAQDDSRPVLASIHVSPKGLMAAANGFMLAIVPCSFVEGEPELPPQGVLVPTVVVKSSVSSRIHRGEGQFQIDLDRNEARCRVKAGHIIANGLIEGQFPDYAKIIPANLEPGSTLSVNPEYYLACCQAIGAEVPAIYTGVAEDPKKQAGMPLVIANAQRHGSALAGKALACLMPMHIEDKGASTLNQQVLANVADIISKIQVTREETS